jgi:hypothetical protein
VKKKKSKFKRGDLVVIYLKDHCFYPFDNGGPVPMKVAGWFLEETDDHYRIETFTPDTTEQDPGDSYAIIKHKGIKIRKAKII